MSETDAKFLKSIKIYALNCQLYLINTKVDDCAEKSSTHQAGLTAVS